MKHESTFTFVSADGQEVKAKRWINPDGSLGGWVANTADVHSSAFVDAGAVVEPGARVEENERLGAGETRASERWVSA